MRRRAWLWVAAVCFLAAAVLTADNLARIHRAQTQSERILAALPVTVTAQKLRKQTPRPDPADDMSAVQVSSAACVGVVEIPALQRRLPVLAVCSDENLRCAPCVYVGSAYRDDMIIAAHNYDAHFGGLSRLGVGDAVRFTDLEGRVFRYRVVEVQTIPETDVAGMLAGRWDVTLFTCTPGGHARVAVRCERV